MVMDKEECVKKLDGMLGDTCIYKKLNKEQGPYTGSAEENGSAIIRTEKEERTFRTCVYNEL